MINPIYTLIMFPRSFTTLRFVPLQEDSFSILYKRNSVSLWLCVQIKKLNGFAVPAGDAYHDAQADYWLQEIVLFVLTDQSANRAFERTGHHPNILTDHGFRLGRPKSAPSYRPWEWNGDNLFPSGNGSPSSPGNWMYGPHTKDGDPSVADADCKFRT